MTITTLQISTVRCAHQTVVTDDERDEIICQHCGIVSDEQSQHDKTSFKPEFRTGMGSPMSSAMCNIGLSTTISKKNSDFKGATLSFANKSRFDRLKIWDSRSKLRTSRQKNVVKAISILYGVKEKLGLSSVAMERIAHIYQMASKKKLVAGRSSIDILGASIYCACRELEIHRTLRTITKTLNTKEKSLRKCYRVLIRNLDVKPEPPKLELALPKICSKVAVDERVKRYAFEILQMAQEKQLTAGFNPSSVCSAAIWISCLHNNIKVSQSKIAKAAGVSTPALRNYAMMLHKKLGLTEQ